MKYTILTIDCIGSWRMVYKKDNPSGYHSGTFFGYEAAAMAIDQSINFFFREKNIALVMKCSTDKI